MSQGHRILNTRNLVIICCARQSNVTDMGTRVELSHSSQGENVPLALTHPWGIPSPHGEGRVTPRLTCTPGPIPSRPVNDTSHSAVLGARRTTHSKKGSRESHAQVWRHTNTASWTNKADTHLPSASLPFSYLAWTLRRPYSLQQRKSTLTISLILSIRYAHKKNIK